jgi:hypothetical protein
VVLCYKQRIHTDWALAYILALIRGLQGSLARLKNKYLLDNTIERIKSVRRNEVVMKFEVNFNKSASDCVNDIGRFNELVVYINS